MVETRIAARRLLLGLLIGFGAAPIALALVGLIPAPFAPLPAQPLGIAEARAGSGVTLDFITTGQASTPGWWIAQGAGGRQPIHFRAAVIDHPDGRVLFGAGASAETGVGRVVNPFGRVTYRSVDVPDDIDAIILPTMRWMHTGLVEAGALGDVPIHVGSSDHWWAFRGPWPGRYGFNRDALREFEDRVHRVSWERRSRLGFSKTYDWFGDGSVLLVALNGTTEDEIGLSVVLDSGRRVLLVGDVVWSHEAVTKRQRRAQWLGWTMDRNRTRLLFTQSRLHQLWRDHEVEVVPLLDGSLAVPESPTRWD